MSAAPLLALTLLLAASGSQKGVQWEKSFDKAMKKAERSDMPLMVDFWAEWCGWCHRLDRTTYVDPVVTAKSKNFVSVKVDTEGSNRDRDVADRYKVHSLPTILFLSPGGLQVLRVSSFMGPGRFPHIMDKALEAAQRVAAWESQLDRDEADAGALGALGAHLFQQECLEESADFLTRAARYDTERPLGERRETRLLLAILHHNEGRYAQAEELIKEALNLGPKGEHHPKLLFVLGRTYVSWGRHQMGVETMQVIVEEYPSSPLAPKAREILEQR